MRAEAVFDVIGHRFAVILLDTEVQGPLPVPLEARGEVELVLLYHPPEDPALTGVGDLAEELQPPVVCRGEGDGALL